MKQSPVPGDAGVVRLQRLGAGRSKPMTDYKILLCSGARLYETAFQLMTAIAFDTLKFAKRLKEGGFTDQQAETLAQAEAEFIEQSLASKGDVKELEVALKRDIEVLREGVKRDIEELRGGVKRDIEELRGGVKRDIEELRGGVKRDIKELEIALKRDVEELRADLKRDVKELEYRMTIKLGAMLTVAVGAMAALVKLL